MTAARGPEPIRYIDRTRAYYSALGYEHPYRWARFDEVPFTPLARPLSDTTVAVVTTAAPFRPEAGDQGPGAPYNAAAKFYDLRVLPADPPPDLRISHVAIDRDHTTAEDPGTWLPLAALRASTRCRAADVVFCLPTNRSHRQSAQDAEKLARLAQGRGIGAAVLVPNCPVCHQSVAFAANALERAGIATVIMGCARDIIEHAGVPRFVFSDFPLGNSAGRPHDPASQRQTLDMALDLLEAAPGPRSMRVSPLQWPGPADWREDYANPARLDPQELARRRAAFDAGRATARTLREGK